MDYFRLILLLLFFVSCKKEAKNTEKTTKKPSNTVVKEKTQELSSKEPTKQQWQNFSFFDKEQESKEQLAKEKLTKKQWQKFGFFNIEKFNPNFDYYITNTSKNLKIIDRLYDYENITWLCIVNKNGFYNDAVEIAYDNDEGFLGITSKMKNDTVIVSTYNEYETPQEKIDTLLIHNNTFRHPAKEKEILGTWINKENSIKIEFQKVKNKLEYTFISPKRTLKNTAIVTHNDYIIFYGFEWSEYAGGAIEEENEQKLPQPPTSFSAKLNVKENSFGFQNYGNAMNYFVIVEEASSGSKYVTFKK